MCPATSLHSVASCAARSACAHVICDACIPRPSDASPPDCLKSPGDGELRCILGLLRCYCLGSASLMGSLRWACMLRAFTASCKYTSSVSHLCAHLPGDLLGHLLGYPNGNLFVCLYCHLSAMLYTLTSMLFFFSNFTLHVFFGRTTS